MEYYSDLKTKKTLTYATTWMNLKHYAKRNKPDTKGLSIYLSIYVKLYMYNSTYMTYLK